VNFQKLFEARASSLDKLGQSSLIDIATDYPEDAVRILFRELERRKIQIKEKSKQKVLEKIREKLNDSLGRGNPWLDTNNHLKFELEDKLANDEVEFDLLVSGNKLLWGLRGGFVSVSIREKNALQLRNRSASEVISELADKAAKVFRKLASPLTSKQDLDSREQIANELYGKKSNLHTIVSNLAEKFGLLGGQEPSEHSGVQIYLRPSPKMIGIPEGEEEKITNKWDAFRNFEYKFQTDALKKAWSQLEKRLESMNYYIVNAGVGGNDYLWLNIEQVSNPKRKSPRWNANYEVVHKTLKERIPEFISQLENKMEDKSLRQVRKEVVINFLERDKK
jgi:hypothetical protein